VIPLPIETPTYDNVRLDLGIDPVDQRSGHDTRVQAIIARHRSVLSLCARCGEAIKLVSNKRRSVWVHQDQAREKDHAAAWKELK
jgi:hypothetical protein